MSDKSKMEAALTNILELSSDEFSKSQARYGLGIIETPDVKECDWCGEPATEFSHPHLRDFVFGKRMCRGCWNHDREVYKGSYGDDIGEFKPIKEGTAD